MGQRSDDHRGDDCAGGAGEEEAELLRPLDTAEVAGNVLVADSDEPPECASQQTQPDDVARADVGDEQQAADTALSGRELDHAARGEEDQ